MSEIKEQLTSQINKMADEGVPQLAFNGDRVDLIFIDQQRYGLPNSALAAPSGSASKLLVWAFKDQILARLLSGAEQVEGITSEERARRSAELEQLIFDLAHQEEALVEAALEQNLEVHRRVDAHPFALLGVEPISEADAAVAQAKAKTLQAVE